MTCFVNLEDSFDPSDNLMGRRVGWFIKVDDSVAFELSYGSFGW